MAENPFAGPFGAGGPFADNSSGQDPASADVIKCPKCRASNFDAKANQWETWRVCRECGNRWSGGIGVANVDASVPLSPPGVPAEEDIAEELYGNQDLTPDYRR